MKKIVAFSISALFLLSMISCTKSSTDSPGEVTPIVTQGEWVVSLFSERGINETSDFSGFSYVFQSGGKLIVKKNGAVVKEGTWSENSSSKKLIIDLGIKDDTNKPQGELTDDWIITSKNDSKISLTDDNSSSAEILEFTKK